MYSYIQLLYIYDVTVLFGLLVVVSLSVLAGVDVYMYIQLLYIYTYDVTVLFGLLVVVALSVFYWGGSSVMCWSAILVVRCGCFRYVSCVATSIILNETAVMAEGMIKL
jgi:hypothetical protein